MLRKIVLTAILGVGLWTAGAIEPPKQFLLSSLKKTEDATERIKIYRNLADMTYRTSETRNYLQPLYRLAQKTGQTDVMMEALADLSYSFLDDRMLDSARYYIGISKELSPSGGMDRWVCLQEIDLFTEELNSNDEAVRAVESKTEALRKRGAETIDLSVYARIETEYSIGILLHDKGEYEEAELHLQKAVELTYELEPKDKFNYMRMTLRMLAANYNRLQKNQIGLDLMKESLVIGEEYHKLCRDERPYYPIEDFLITTYSSMMINSFLMTDEEARSYLDKMQELCAHSENIRHRYRYFYTLNNYYLSRRDWDNSLITNDSLIRYAWELAPMNVPGLYELNATIYDMLDKPRKALSNLRMSIVVRDSLVKADIQEQLTKMRVLYDVNRLNYEKSQLEVRNKHMMITGLLGVLLLVLVVCAYLYTHLKRERRMKEHMQLLKQQAEESENLKTAFINSICHEIRTPLNGIVGFSELMTDPSIDAIEKDTFTCEIQQNTDQLVSLVNSMLEVANLDVSKEKLTCVPADLTHMCSAEFKRFSAMNQNPNIEARAELPERPLVIATNERYLSMVIEQLLDNAYKFTCLGHVTLSCRRCGDEVEIAVADTGCGIPADKREAVFDRFIKLDSYKPGSGLGLYLCKSIVSRLSGRIFVDPDYIGGTRMVVVLPLK